MQNSFDKYKQFDAAAFALDEGFIGWVINPDADTDVFWNGFLLENPGQVENVLHAKKLIISFQNHGEKAPAELKNRIWQSVMANKAKSKVISMKNRRAWMTAAAIIVLLVAGYTWFYFNNSTKTKMPVLATKEIKNDIAPGGNRATLTLANGSIIILDSAQNGSLAIQGNTQVVKLKDGKLAYEQSAISNQQTAIQYNTITTPRGGQYQLKLADGSQVWLNAESSITFPTSFVGNKREVEITGEVYFEVAHNANMPFHVNVNKMDVEVLGTHFNVNAYEDEGVLKTTLLEGSVKISEGNNMQLLSPGQQAQVNDNGHINLNKNVDVEQVMAWKNGLFNFNKTKIDEIMRQMGRWYDVEVKYQGAKPNITLSGTINRSINATKVLNMLELSGVHFRIESKKIVVIGE